jgi:hypothetical protein
LLKKNNNADFDLKYLLNQRDCKDVPLSHFSVLGCCFFGGGV